MITCTAAGRVAPVIGDHGIDRINLARGIARHEIRKTLAIPVPDHHPDRRRAATVVPLVSRDCGNNYLCRFSRAEAHIYPRRRFRPGGALLREGRCRHQAQQSY